MSTSSLTRLEQTLPVGFVRGDLLVTHGEGRCEHLILIIREPCRVSSDVKLTAGRSPGRDSGVTRTSSSSRRYSLLHIGIIVIDDAHERCVARVNDRQPRAVHEKMTICDFQN